MLSIGEIAPDFSLPDADGNLHTLSSYIGSKIVLYFYPKDNTSGCTKEACEFNERLPDFSELKVPVIGISVDSQKSHKNFISKYGLNFILLSDAEKDVVSKYQVWKEKSMYGKKYFGIERTTFVISEKGEIIKIYPKVSVAGHVEQILQDLKQL